MKVRVGAKPLDVPNCIDVSLHEMPAETRLQRVLGARVRIVRSPRGAGKIVIRFKSDDELDRLFVMLLDDPTTPGVR